jgi:hypothetical protein
MLFAPRSKAMLEAPNLKWFDQADRTGSHRVHATACNPQRGDFRDRNRDERHNSMNGLRRIGGL